MWIHIFRDGDELGMASNIVEDRKHVRIGISHQSFQGCCTRAERKRFFSYLNVFSGIEI